nr:CapA family protein [Leptotrichia shahii]
MAQITRLIYFKNNANILENTQDILQNADITVGNLEGTLFDTGGTQKAVIIKCMLCFSYAVKIRKILKAGWV